MNEKSSLYEINDVGMFIWQCIDGQSDASEITKKLMTQLNDDVPFDVVYEDTVDFIRVLINEGFIVEGAVTHERCM